MLKADHGLAHGAAHRVSLLAGNATTPAHRTTGPGRGPLRWREGRTPAAARCPPRRIRALGAFDIAPKKGSLSLRRRKAVRDDPAQHYQADRPRLILPAATPATGRLEPAAKFNPLFTHRVRITAATDLGDELARLASHRVRARRVATRRHGRHVPRATGDRRADPAVPPHVEGHRLYTLFHLIALRGPRRGEAAGLAWSGLDPRRRNADGAGAAAAALRTPWRPVTVRPAAPAWSRPRPAPHAGSPGHENGSGSARSAPARQPAILPQGRGPGLDSPDDRPLPAFREANPLRSAALALRYCPASPCAPRGGPSAVPGSCRCRNR